MESNKRKRYSDMSYTLKTKLPNGTIDIKNNIDTIEDIALYINKTFFNNWTVVSRSMVNNWTYYNGTRRDYANAFSITRVVS
jgi:hypothetical protein